MITRRTFLRLAGLTGLGSLLNWKQDKMTQARFIITANTPINLAFVARQVTINNPSLFWVYIRTGANDIPNNRSFDYACPPQTFFSFVTDPAVQSFGIGFTPSTFLGSNQQCSIIFSDTINPIAAANAQSPLLSNIQQVSLTATTFTPGNTTVQTAFTGYAFRVYSLHAIFRTVVAGLCSLDGLVMESPVVGTLYDLYYPAAGKLLAVNQDLVFTNSAGGNFIGSVYAVLSIE